MRIGWFTTARGPGSLNLFTTMRNRIRSGDIDAKLSFVFINRDIKGNEYRKKIVQMAEEDGVPVIIFPSDGFKPELKTKDIEAWRDAYGAGVRERISRYPMDFGVLAGYMLIIDPQTCREYDLINLHPALPDSYKGTWEEIVTQVVDNGDPTYGATVHVCSPELDRGSIIAFDSFGVGPLMSRHAAKGELVQAVRDQEVQREAPLLMEAIKMIVDGEIVLRKGEVLGPRGERVDGYPDLSDRVTSALSRPY
ncbi:MAG: formyltransferase family protein [Methanomassiliicoccus sp.]|nr:formyltransferase family protein [Methanomassiliicoccus sp.]